MIEREFVKQKKKEFQIQEMTNETMKNVGHSSTKLSKTPLGEKIIINTSRPGLVVGRKGENISHLTQVLKKKFKLENPQVEINEIENPNLDARIVAERIAATLEKFGSKRFKGAMHSAMEDSISAGAVGVEIKLSGKVPSSRARSWRIYQGYLKKCGDAAINEVKRAHVIAKLKSGVIGIKVRIMPPGIRLGDSVEILETQVQEQTEETAEAKAEKAQTEEEVKEEKKTTKKKKKRATRRKKAVKKEDDKNDEGA